jgi:hypothetical protein
MDTPDIGAAERFLAANARVLERRRFARLFRGGEPGPVRDALAAYRNADGGFGHALEPDGRCPGSQPLAIDFALQVMLETGTWDSGLAGGACGWLAARAPAGGGAVFVAETVAGWPHAPWWVPEEGDPASLITTGLLAGSLHAGGMSHPWLEQATALLWERIATLDKTSPYDLRALLWFLEKVPDPGRARAAAARLCPMIIDQGLVAMEPGAPGEVHTPLDFAPRPGSPARAVFSQPVIDAHLDHLAAAQQPDGGWTFNWPVWSPAAEREWRGHCTIAALTVLRDNGRPGD